MLAASVSNDVWIGTALIAAITVLSCMGFICARLRYELELIDVVSDVKSLRNKIAQQLDQAGEEAAEQPSRWRRDVETADSETPTPDAEASVDTEEIIEIQPEPKVVPPDSAEAA